LRRSNLATASWHQRGIELAGQSRVPALVARLRDLEAECLRLTLVDVQNELQSAKRTYEGRLEQLDKSHSRSWFGDHATTYYAGFQPPPGGRTFDVEWGFVPGFHGSRNRGWETYSREELRDFVLHDIGEQIFYEFHNLSEQITGKFSTARDQTIDVLEVLSGLVKSNAMNRYKARAEELKSYEVADYINGCLKSTPNMTRDSEEIAKGKNVPVHIQYQAAIQSVQVTKKRASELAVVLRNVIEAISLHEPSPTSANGGSAVFIGHGRSEQWRVLKDFIKERLGLSHEEFSRVPTAGISTQERLMEMLGRCGFAFLVLTAEDLHDDGSRHARENVIHEAGLFQGHLGWRKAIILLEHGCEEFSNITGLGQIRFPKGDIAACFEDIRLVLERENILGTPAN
jgi:predicted nucleotide-binding protein